MAHVTRADVGWRGGAVHWLGLTSLHTDTDHLGPGGHWLARGLGVILVRLDGHQGGGGAGRWPLGHRGSSPHLGT